MKTPDGYCAWHPEQGFDFAVSGADPDFVAKVIMGDEMIGYEVRPCCLVDPRLLEWVEKVRRAYYDHSSADSFLDDMGQLVDVELKEITGEG